MKGKLTLGGGAQFDGVMIRSENFSATVRCVEGDDPHCELTEKRAERLPKWLGILSMIPLLRGILLPLLIVWQVRGGDAFGKQKPASMLDRIVGLAMLVAICLLFAWFSGYFPPGLLRNSVAYAPFLLLLGGGIIWMRTCMPGMLMYHGAEHKAVWMLDRTDAIPDWKSAARWPRLHPRCGSCLIANQLAVFVAVSLLWPTLSLWWIWLAMMVVSTELMYLAKYRIGGLLNIAGLFLQCITTIEPQRKHLRVSCAAVRAVIDLENGKVPEELPRTRRFRDLDELEEQTGWKALLP